jgi:murein DD-endopeptidase MepM/ murein hydrolase activator NlpD
MKDNKFISYPVFPWYVTQQFGEDKACVNDAGKVVSKETAATCPVGYRSLYTLTKGHNGLDVRAARWQPVYAAHDGIVTEVQTEEARGLGVGIVSNGKYFCTESGKDEHFKTRYWHFIALDVHRGEKVKVGDLIGWADSTGYSSGDHLHLELKPVKILEWENGLPIYNNVLQNNGFLGAINPTPYMNGISALQMAGLIRQIAELTARIAEFIADRLRWGRR